MNQAAGFIHEKRPVSRWPGPDRTIIFFPCCILYGVGNPENISFSCLHLPALHPCCRCHNHDNNNRKPPCDTGSGTSGAPAATATTPAGPDREVLTGSWDSREVWYASNHDIREEGVWAEPVRSRAPSHGNAGTPPAHSKPGTVTAP